MAVLEALFWNFFADNGYKNNIKRLGIKDEFVEHGTPDELYEMLGLHPEGIAREIAKFTIGVKELNHQN